MKIMWTVVPTYFIQFPARQGQLVRGGNTRLSAGSLYRVYRDSGADVSEVHVASISRLCKFPYNFMFRKNHGVGGSGCWGPVQGNMDSGQGKLLNLIVRTRNNAVLFRCCRYCQLFL
jgi:hypothetical protein